MANRKEMVKALGDLVVGSALCASFFDTTERNLRKMKALGCPKDGYGRWNLYEVKKWMEDNDFMADKATEGDEDIHAAKLKNIQVKTQIDEIKRDKLLGELVPVEEITPQWIAAATEIRAVVLTLVDILPPLLDGKTQLEMRPVINNICDTSILAPLSTGREYCPQDGEEVKPKVRDLKVGRAKKR